MMASRDYQRKTGVSLQTCQRHTKLITSQKYAGSIPLNLEGQLRSKYIHGSNKRLKYYIFFDRSIISKYSYHDNYRFCRIALPEVSHDDLRINSARDNAASWANITKQPLRAYASTSQRRPSSFTNVVCRSQKVMKGNPEKFEFIITRQP